MWATSTARGAHASGRGREVIAADGPANGRPAPRSWRRVVLFTGFAALVWVTAVGVSLSGVPGRLATAREDLIAARDLVVEGDVTAARSAFADASDDLAGASAAVGRPWVAPVRWLPIVGDDLRFGGRLLDATVAASTAGEVALAAAEAALADHEQGDGRLPVRPLAGLAEPLGSLADAVRDVEVLVASSYDQDLVGPIARQRDQLSDLVVPLSEQSRLAADVARLLPPLLGSESPRTFLLFASNPAELRGTGGYLGAYALATINDGQLEIGDFASLFDLPELGPEAVEPPNGDYLSRYRRYGGTGAWQNVNLTPDFPSAALVYERLWELAFQQRLDGVIAVDPFAYEALLGVAGSVEVPGLIELDADNVVDYVTNGAYRDIDDPTERQQVLGAVAAATLEAFLGRLDADRLPDTARLLADLAIDGHLQMHASDPATQDVLARAGVAGAFALQPGGIALVTNSASANKIDYYVRHHLDLSINLRADGGARTQLRVELENRAPVAGVPRYVIGPNQPFLLAGESYRLVSLFCGDDCFIATAPESLLLTGDYRSGRGEEIQTDLVDRVTAELGSVVVDTFVSVPARSSAHLIYEYVQPGVWETTPDGGIVYRFGLRGQRTITPPKVRISVEVPDGFVATGLPNNAEVVDGRVIIERTPRGSLDLQIAFSPIDDAAG